MSHYFKFCLYVCIFEILINFRELIEQKIFSDTFNFRAPLLWDLAPLNFRAYHVCEKQRGAIVNGNEESTVEN